MSSTRAQPNTSTNPDGVKEAATYYTYSPEDVDQNGFLDNWGGKNIGYGFGVNTNTAPPNPYLTTTCNTIGLSNAVSGARHVLKLVAAGADGAGNSYLPVRADNGLGGFTVASENPVYVQGNYNSSSADPFWGGGSNTTPHSAAAIIADAVTVLSNNWTDANSLNNPTNLGGPQRSHQLLPDGCRGRQERSIPHPGLGRRQQRLRHRRRLAQLPALSGNLGRTNPLLQRIAGQHVLLGVRHRRLQMLHDGVQPADT